MPTPTPLLLLLLHPHSHCHDHVSLLLLLFLLLLLIHIYTCIYSDILVSAFSILILSVYILLHVHMTYVYTFPPTTTASRTEYHLRMTCRTSLHKLPMPELQLLEHKQTSGLGARRSHHAEHTQRPRKLDLRPGSAFRLQIFSS